MLAYPQGKTHNLLGQVGIPVLTGISKLPAPQGAGYLLQGAPRQDYPGLSLSKPVVLGWALAFLGGC